MADYAAKAVVGLQSQEKRKRQGEDLPDPKRTAVGKDIGKDDDYDPATTPVDNRFKQKFSSSALLSVLNRCSGLHRKGKSLYDDAQNGKGSIDEAVKYFEKEVETLEGIPTDNCDTTSQLKVFLALANAHAEFGKCLLETGPKKQKSDKPKATTQSRSVLVHFQKGVEANMKYNKLAIESKMTDGSDMQENRELMWSSYNKIGMVLEEHYSEYRRAAKEYENAYDLALSLFEETKSTMWGGYVVISCWNKGLALAGLTNDIEAGRASWKELTAALHFIINRLDVNVAEKKRRIKVFSDEYFNIGSSYADLELRNQGRYDEEFKVYKDVYEICNRAGNKEGTAIALTNIGNALDDIEGSNMRAILTMYWQSAVIAQEMGNKGLIETALGNLNSVFEGRMKELLEEFEKTQDISKVNMDFIAELADTTSNPEGIIAIEIDSAPKQAPIIQPTEIVTENKSGILYELIMYGSAVNHSACSTMKKVVVREDEPSWWLRRRYFGEDLPNRSNISRQHFSISRDSTNPHKFYLKDSSCHGTAVNEDVVKAGALIALKNGDTISFLGSPRDPKLGFLFKIPQE